MTQRYQQIRQVLGSEAVLTVILSDNSDANTVFDLLWSQINQFEQCFSRFLPESELSKFNRQAGEIVEISSEFKKLLTTSKEMSQKTKGVFNPFVLPALQQAGYIGSWPETEKMSEVMDYRHGQVFPTCDQLTISHNTAKIPKNSALDLGGIGKGYLLDMLSLSIKKQGIHRYWFSLGGDIICNGLDVDDKPWQILVSDALLPENTIEDISNYGQKMAIATSGTLKRRGEHLGESWHHLIDIKTKKPTQTDVLSATVCANKAVIADVAAKCLVIGGSVKMKITTSRLPISFALLQLWPEKSVDKIKNNSCPRIMKYFRKEK